MRLTLSGLTRATLQRQMLARREAVDVDAAVGRLVGIQAQEPVSPFIALWNRLEDFDSAHLTRALADMTIIKAPLMRITLHAVTTADYPDLHAAVAPILRAARLNDRRYREAGLDVADADGAVADLLAFLRRPRSKNEVLDHLSDRFDEAQREWLWWALRTAAPILRAPTNDPWSFGQHPTYVAAPFTMGTSHQDAVDMLVGRYLRGYGPASAHDISQFTLLPMSVVRPALARLEPQLVTHDGPADETLYDHADAPEIPPPDQPVPPRLLGMWDNVLLAYRDRSRLIPDDHRSLVIRRNGDVLPTVLVDGRVVGVWRVIDAAIEVTAFEPISDEAIRGLDGEAVRLLRFLDAHEPAIYTRSHRWWASMPSTSRLLIGSAG